MEYTWKDLAENLGVSVATVRRAVKKLGIEGRLIDPEEGVPKRIFSEVDYDRLKSVIAPLQPLARRNENLPEPLSTSLSESLSQQILQEVFRAMLAEALEGVASRLDAIQSEGQAREERHREELQAQEEQHSEELVALGEELNQERESSQEAQENAQKNQEDLKAELMAICKELAELKKPWWKRLWSKDP